MTKKEELIIANWRNENEYDFFDKAKRFFEKQPSDAAIKKIYAWQFLRRNKDYQNDFVKFKSFEKSRNQEKTQNFSNHLKTKYSLHFLLPPSPDRDIPFFKSKQDFEAVDTERLHENIHSDLFLDPEATFSFRPMYKAGLEDKDYTLKINFDLRNTVSQNLELAKIELQKWQNSYLQKDDKLWQPRVRTITEKDSEDYLIRLLRISDAVRSGASKKEICNEIFSISEQNIDESYRNTRDAAWRFINQDYPSIAFMKKIPTGINAKA